MKLNRPPFTSIAVSSLTFALVLSVTTTLGAQMPAPVPDGQVSDLAKTIDEPTKQRLEVILSKLKQRTAVNLTVVTVQSTAGLDIFDFSRQLARSWDLGATTSSSKSLLLVLAVNEKTFFTQFSKKAQGDLPEGALGQMNQQMRNLVESGRMSDGLLAGVQSLVAAIGRKTGFSLGEMDPLGSSPTYSEAKQISATPQTNVGTANGATFTPTSQVAEVGPNEPTNGTGPNPAPKSNSPEVNANTDSTTGAVGPSSTSGTDLINMYRVGIGDQLDIRLGATTAEEPTPFTVNANGLLEYPPLGQPLNVVGQTTDEIGQAIKLAFKRQDGHKSSEVQVGVREYASHTILVSGLVKDAGTKILRREAIPLYVVIADAQPLPEATRATVFSHKTGVATVVDLTDSKGMGLLVLPGDVITVQREPKQFFYIGGEVKVPGEKSFHPGITLTQAILMAGGLTPKGGAEVEIAREGADGTLTVNRYKLKEINSGKLRDPLLGAGDRITVAH